MDRLITKTHEIINEILNLFFNKYFYLGLTTLIIGIRLNYYSQKYLLDYIESGNSLPSLPDLILENIPYWDIDYLYDIFSIFSILVLIIFVVHKRQYSKVPYFLLLVGIFQIIRGFFIVLTPFGNPMGFNGTQGPFYGFTDIELGVYPSGHTGVAYLYFLLVETNPYKYLLLLSVVVIIAAHLLSRGHYTIDILTGIIFAYAIKSFGDNNLLKHIEPKFIHK